MLSGVSSAISLRRSEQDRAVRAPVLVRRAARAGRQPERQRRLYRLHRAPPDHRRQRQHQPARSEVPAARAGDGDDAERRQPVLRQPERRQLRDARDAAAQPAAAAVPAVRHRQHGRDQPRQVAVPRRRDPGAQAHDVVERQLQLHLQPPVGQPVRPGQLLHLGAGPAEQLHLHRRLRLLQSRRGVRAQPARLAAQGVDDADRAAAVRRRPPLLQREQGSPTRSSATGPSRR